jgi:peptidyl-prolyl cis-trans isomerase-like 4
MALLLETTWGDLVIDLDVEGSPALCRNILKLAKARYYSSTLVYNVQPNRFCQLGDPRGDGTGGGCIHGLLDNNEEDITSSKARFLKSKGRILSPKECRERGRVVATEMNGIPDTIGSQFLVTLEDGEGRALDGYIPPHHGEDTSTTPRYLSLGLVTEDDDNVLDRIHNAYCDANGRPYGDIRIERALVIHDPFEDPPGLQELMETRGIVCDNEGDVTSSPSYERPPEERVEIRIPANQVVEEEDELDPERARQREEEIKKKEDTSRAVVLEMLGDLPSAGTYMSFELFRENVVCIFRADLFVISFLFRYKGARGSLVCVPIESNYTR